MENNLNERLEEMLQNKHYKNLKNALIETNEVDIALFLEELDSEQVAVVFRMLPKEMAAEVFAHLSTEMQQYIIESITDSEIANIIEDLYVDDAVDFLEEMPASVVKKVLRNATNDRRVMINQFLKYPENSAGSIMTAEFVDLNKNMTVAEAFARIRKIGIDKETIYTCYVIDSYRRLEGIVSVRRLFISKDEDIIGDIMDTNIIKVTTTDDREDTVALFTKYGFLSMPVVDHENRLVGIVTVDDAVEVLEEEATEDFEKMAAMRPSEKPYLKTSVFELSKNRIVWLLVLMFSAMLTGSILQTYEEAFTVLPILVTFIPMLTDTGGNSGSQSSTMIIRGMSVGEIQSNDLLKVFWKELRVGLLCGLVLGGANFLRLYLTYQNHSDTFMISLTVGLSVFAIVVLAKTIGGLLPMAAKMLKLDPAIMASPLITTIVDAVGLILYFKIAQLLLPQLR